MGDFYINNDAWDEFRKIMNETNYSNSIYSYSIDLTKVEPPKKKELSIKDKLDVLMCAINYALDCGNRDEFQKLSNDYNKLRLQMV